MRVSTDLARVSGAFRCDRPNCPKRKDMSFIPSLRQIAQYALREAEEGRFPGDADSEDERAYQADDKK